LAKIIHGVVDLVIERDLDEFRLREHLPDLPAEGLVHPIIVVGEKESPVNQIPPQPLGFFGGESDVSVTRHVEERVIEQIFVQGTHMALLDRNLHSESLFERAGQIR
jgi:hypothetical protein